MGARSGKVALPSSSKKYPRCELCEVAVRRGTVSGRDEELYAEECSRCHRQCCSNCCTWRRYGSLFATYEKDECIAEFMPVCTHCLSKVNLILSVPRSAWAIINEYCDATSKHRLLQVCHATQMGVLLDYPYIRYGWSTLFDGKTVISKTTNGEVYKTTLRKDIGQDLPKGMAGVLDMQTIAALGGTTVAVKTIRKSSIFSLRKWEHTQREVDSLRKCRHRHVVQLHFVAQSPSEVYIVLQYVAGGDLFDWLVSQQFPMEYDVVVIARQLLQTLHFMHEVCNVVHRDIKPENILLQPVEAPRLHPQDADRLPEKDGTLKSSFSSSDELYIRLADFGYAKMLPHSASIALSTSPAQSRRLHLPSLCSTSHGAVGVAATRATEDFHPSESQLSNEQPFLISSTPCGTLGFAAPEILSAYNAQKTASRLHRSSWDSADATDTSSQPRTSVDLVKRMDIFAAGVTICILLTGCEPYPCLSSKEHMNAVQSGLDFSGPQWNYVSQSAKKLLRRMLAPRAADRPSALECLNSSWLKHEDVYADAISEVDDLDNIVHGKGLHYSNSVWELRSTSFLDAVHSLRKNEGWLFVQDAQGLVTTVPRHLVNESENGNAFPEALTYTSAQSYSTAIC